VGNSIFEFLFAICDSAREAKGSDKVGAKVEDEDEDDAEAE
jgi:hypothetical protein